MPRRTRVLVLVLIGALAAGAMGGNGTTIVPRRKRAVVIGVNRSRDLAQLRYASDDADLFATTLRENLRFSPDEIRILRTGGETEPTRANVLRAVDETLADPSLSSGELFVLYFSGHGVGGADGDYLVPTDASVTKLATEGIRVNEILARITAKGLSNVVLVADACRSGAKNAFGKELLAQARKANVALMLGCAPGSRSYEYPELGHGVYTYYLARAIGDDANLDEYGALWTSRIAARVGGQVRQHTAVEYGSDAQKPGGWADPARDVMLRVSPPNLTPEQLSGLSENPRGLTPEMYAASTTALMYALFEQGRMYETVRLGKTLEALGTADEDSLLLLGTVLIHLGRSGEADGLLRRLARSENPMIADLALVLNEAAVTDVGAKVTAAERLWHRRGDEATALLTWGTFKRYASPERQRTCFVEMEKRLPRGSRAVALIRGDTALTAGDLRTSRTELERALLIPSDILGDAPIVTLLGTIHVLQEDAAALEALTKRFETREGGNGAALASLATHWSLLRRRDRALAVAKEALGRGGLEEMQAESCFRAAGHRVGEIVPEFDALSKARPYDWRTRMYALLAKSAVTEQPFPLESFLREVLVYAGSELEVYAALFPAIEVVLADGILARVREPEEMNAVRLVASETLKREASRFGRRGELWALLVVDSLGAEDANGAATLFAKYVGAPRKGDDPELWGAALTLAMTADDPVAMAKVWNDAGFRGVDRPLYGWPYAMSLFARGDVAAARRIAATLPDLTTSGRHFARSLRLALGGDRAALLAYRPEDEADAAIVGLALERLGESSRRDELLSPSVATRTVAALPVSAAAIRTLSEAARRRGDAQEVARLAYSCATSLAGARAFDRISALVSPRVEDYATHFEGEATLGNMADFTHENTLRGRVVADSLPDGTFRLSMRGTDATEILANGRVDADGNLFATATIAGEFWTVRAKLVPPSLWKDVPNAATIGQPLIFTGPNGDWAILLLRPAEDRAGTARSDARHR